jgi:hypothetical protein
MASSVTPFGRPQILTVELSSLEGMVVGRCVFETRPREKNTSNCVTQQVAASSVLLDVLLVFSTDGEAYSYSPVACRSPGLSFAHDGLLLGGSSHTPRDPETVHVLTARPPLSREMLGPGFSSGSELPSQCKLRQGVTYRTSAVVSACLWKGILAYTFRGPAETVIIKKKKNPTASRTWGAGRDTAPESAATCMWPPIGAAVAWGKKSLFLEWSHRNSVSQRRLRKMHVREAKYPRQITAQPAVWGDAAPSCLGISISRDTRGLPWEVAYSPHDEPCRVRFPGWR